jgi:hypothetical protein
MPDLEVASSFTSTPIEPSLRGALVDAGIAGGVGFSQYGQMSGYMLSAAVDSEQIVGTVVLLRVEDWLRELLKPLPPGPIAESVKQAVRKELGDRVDEFAKHLARLTQRGKQTWFMACPSTGWIAARHSLGTLCRTYTNLVLARVQAIGSVTVLKWPLLAEADDHGADRLGQIPFTQDAFDALGSSIGDLLRKSLKKGSRISQATDSTELADYLKGLNVHVALAVARRSDRVYVDKFLRTAAAFSLTGEKREISDQEVDAIIDSGGCMLISVRDRHSDQGISGLVAVRMVGDTLVVDAFSLSCVVLGKQVEHAAVSAIAGIAADRHLPSIVFHYQPAERNQPARVFLDAVAVRSPGGSYSLPTAEAETRLAGAAISPQAWTVEWDINLTGSVVR